MQKILTLTGQVLKMALGLFFIVSALSKFVGIDSFEVYVYGLNLLPLGLSQIAARLVIVAELLLALMLITGWKHRLTMTLTTLVLLAFTMLLAGLAVSGRMDSCHCMGELMPFNPVQSILKNAVLLMVTLLAWHWADEKWHPRWWMTVPLIALTVEMIVQCGYWGVIYLTRFMRGYVYVWMAVLVVVTLIASLQHEIAALNKMWVTLLLAFAPLVTIFILSAPDSWLPEQKGLTYDNQVLERQMNGGMLDDVHVKTGRKVMCLYSISCHYCQMASQKIGTMQQRLALPDSCFVTVFPQARKDGAVHSDLFYAESHAPRHYELSLPADTFLYITYGRFPTVLFLENGNVVRQIDYRDISEKDIKWVVTPNMGHTM